MRIKWIFVIANSISVVIMFTFLFISYVYMVLPANIIIWLSVITVFSSLVSAYVNYLFTKPVERSIHMLAKQSSNIANGHFKKDLPVEGPAEIAELTTQFNVMNQRLQEAFKQLKEAEASRRELVANISHDLRTPMTSIKAFVSAIQDGVVEDEHTFQRYMESIVLETERLDTLISQLFQLSLLDSGAIDLKRERMSADELLLAVLQHKQIQIEEKQLQVKINMPEKTPMIFIDRFYFQQALFNLLENAIKFSNKGGAIQVDLQTEDNKLTIAIIDFGEGISAKDLPHIFDRTYRAEKSRNQQFGGSGLGLAIAKTIVERHGGTLTAQSKLGEGSTFVITISAADAKEGVHHELENLFPT